MSSRHLKPALEQPLHVSNIGALLVLASILEACVPLPNHAFVSPAVIGKVHRNGKPVADAVVYIEHPQDESCAFKSEVVTRTNSAGEFRFEPREELQFFVAMDPTHNWQVCIVDGDRRYQGWYQHGIGRLAGIGRPAPEVTLDCNLEDRPSVTQIGNTLGKTAGMCSASWKYN